MSSTRRKNKALKKTKEPKISKELPVSEVDKKEGRRPSPGGRRAAGCGPPRPGRKRAKDLWHKILNPVNKSAAGPQTKYPWIIRNTNGTRKTKTGRERSRGWYRALEPAGKGLAWFGPWQFSFAPVHYYGMAGPVQGDYLALLRVNVPR